MRFGYMVPFFMFSAGCSQNDRATSIDDVRAEQAKVAQVLATQILSADTAKTSDEEWGRFVEYFSGETEGVVDLLSGTAAIKPGMEIHPPHKHAEEEFLMVLEGKGTWTLGDKDFPAKKGDMLYSKGWDLHGIKNTGDTVLKFVFWKWHSKGTELPVDPEK